MEDDLKLQSLKAYQARCAHLLLATDEYQADLGSILVQINELQKLAGEGFESDRVNMKADGGVSRLNEAMPAIVISCVNIKLKITDMLIEAVSTVDQPDTNITLNITTANAEDTL